MTRGNTETLDNGGWSAGSGKKLSREALRLMDTNLALNVLPVLTKAKARRSALDPEAKKPSERHKNRPSAPALPERGSKPELAEKQPDEIAGPVNDVNASGNKRTAATADVPAEERHEAQEIKRRKRQKSLEHQDQQQHGASVGKAGASGDLKSLCPADPAALISKPCTGIVAGDDGQSAENKRSGKSESKRKDKNKDRTGEDAGKQSASNGRMSAEDPVATRQPAAASKHSKKAPKEKGHASTGTSDRPSNTTRVREPEPDAQHTTSQPVDAATKLKAATHAGTAVPTTAMPLAGAPLQPNAVPGPALFSAQREDAATTAPSAAAGPGTSESAQQHKEGFVAGAMQLAAPSVNVEEGGLQFPATGTTPVRALLPISVLPVEELRLSLRAFDMAQHQVSDLKAMYEELKETKIHEVDAVLGMARKSIDEQVHNAEELVRHWRDAAALAEEKLKAAGIQEMARRINMLEDGQVQLMNEKSDLLERITQLQKELSLTQQALHDARAKLLQFEMTTLDDTLAQAETGQVRGIDNAHRTLSEAADQEPSPDPALGRSCSPIVHDAAKAHGVAGRRSNSFSTSLKFPTPLPNTSASPSSQSVRLFPMQGRLEMIPGSGERSVGHGVSTECQRIVHMLPNIRPPSPIIGSHLQQGPLSEPSLCGAGSGDHGLSTECQRVIEMLPGLWQPSPSVQSRFARGIAPSSMQSDILPTVEGVTRVMASGADEQSRDQEQSSMRRSDGSPIDGICGSANRKAACVVTLENLLNAHSLCAPEAVRQQEQYSFVDLNPAFARKPARPLPVSAGVSGSPAAVPGVTEPGNMVEAVDGAQAKVPGPNMEAVMEVLPLSPRHLQQVHPSSQAIYPQESGPAAAAMAAAALVNSGSIVSNQDSCNLSGMVARSMVQLQDSKHPTRESDPVPQASGDRSPMSASKMPTALQPKAVSVRAPKMQADSRGGQKPENAFPRPPSPRTAALHFYESVLGWHVDMVSVKPLEVLRMTHTVCGMSFEIRETELDDDALLEYGRPTDGMKFYEYTPLELGTVSELLPEFLKEVIVISKDHRSILLEKLDLAIKAARSKKP